MKYRIHDLDDTPYEETEHIIQVLSKSICMNCDKPYRVGSDVYVYHSPTEGIRWWHKKH